MVYSNSLARLEDTDQINIKEVRKAETKKQMGGKEWWAEGQKHISSLSKLNSCLPSHF